MSNFKIILINFNTMFPMCRMMAPMGNGDLGHHPEKMLPPPEAPDIQVDIVKKIPTGQYSTIFFQTFLTSNKERVDDDPDANPYDDLRHYAYEVGLC